MCAIETSMNIASLIAGSSLTAASILIAFMSFMQAYYLELTKDVPEKELSPEEARKAYRRIRLVEYLTHSMHYLKILTMILTISFILAFFWILMIETGMRGGFVKLFSIVTMALFLGSFIPLATMILRIPMGGGKH